MRYPTSSVNSVIVSKLNVNKKAFMPYYKDIIELNLTNVSVEQLQGHCPSFMLVMNLVCCKNNCQLH